MANRILVTGRYINPSTYVLYKEDGSVYMTIKEGEAFWIDNQFRPFHPIRIEKYNGRGTILICQKFGNKGNVIEEIPLVHNKRGLWALTSGAARNGVFHNYYEPQNLLEKQLASMEVSRKLIEKVEKIDVQITIAEQLSIHTVKQLGYKYITDNATYIIHYRIGTHFNGDEYISLQKIYITPQANEEEVVNKLRNLK